MSTGDQWTVVDMFSGAGGVSCGFHAHPRFRVVGAVDAQIGKPSSGKGALHCNRTFEANMGFSPLEADIGELEPEALREHLEKTAGVSHPTVLIACPPCTGFSRTLNKNHSEDDPRNSLVTHSADFVRELRPAVFLMENARELINGNFSHHYERLVRMLSRLGYRTHGRNYFLNRFGLPQQRERALVIAVREDLPLHTIEGLWDGYTVEKTATHVRRAISGLPPVEAGMVHPDDPMHGAPAFANETSLRRMQSIPRDGGSWADLVGTPEADYLLTPAMQRYASAGEFGSHPDIYGRLWWDRPAVTVKRECGHVGNGRYAHPEQDRLCTVREMSLLQGFPQDYRFVSSSVTNMYRHIGDAVPPLVSYQLACVCEWVLTGRKPEIESVILPNSHLTVTDIRPASKQECDEQLMLFAIS